VAALEGAVLVALPPLKYQSAVLRMVLDYLPLCELTRSARVTRAWACMIGGDFACSAMWLRRRTAIPYGSWLRESLQASLVLGGDDETITEPGRASTAGGNGRGHGDGAGIDYSRLGVGVRFHTAVADRGPVAGDGGGGAGQRDADADTRTCCWWQRGVRGGQVLPHCRTAFWQHALALPAAAACGVSSDTGDGSGGSGGNGHRGQQHDDTSDLEWILNTKDASKHIEISRGPQGKHYIRPLHRDSAHGKPGPSRANGALTRKQRRIILEYNLSSRRNMMPSALRHESAAVLLEQLASSWDWKAGEGVLGPNRMTATAKVHLRSSLISKLSAFSHSQLAPLNLSKPSNVNIRQLVDLALWSGCMEVRDAEKIITKKKWEAVEKNEEVRIF
jgi:hypothetical protein